MLLAGLKFLMKPLSRFGHALVFGAMDDKVRAILGGSGPSATSAISDGSSRCTGWLCASCPSGSRIHHCLRNTHAPA